VDALDIHDAIPGSPISLMPGNAEGLKARELLLFTARRRRLRVQVTLT